MFDRVITLSKTKILPLATVYGLSSLFFLANFYSWGFSPIFLLAPLYGVFWIYFESYIIHKITSVDVLELVTRSKTPYFLLLAMWTSLIFYEPESAFVLNGFAIFMSFIINILSMILLIRSLPFSALRSTVTVFISSISLFVITLIAMLFVRFIYINLHN